MKTAFSRMSLNHPLCRTVTIATGSANATVATAASPDASSEFNSGTRIGVPSRPRDIPRMNHSNSTATGINNPAMMGSITNAKAGTVHIPSCTRR